jgi:DNA-binding NtrC family response regulator
MEKRSSEQTIHHKLENIIKEMVDKDIDLKTALREFEKIYFEQSAKKHEGNRTSMSKALRIHRNTLHNRIKALKIKTKH